MVTANKLLNFVPATNSVASTGLPTLCCGSPLAKRYVNGRYSENGCRRILETNIPN